LYGKHYGLPPLLIYVGENEILYDDAVCFAEKAKAAGMAATRRVGEGLFHCYPVCALFFPEATQAMNEICQFNTGGQNMTIIQKKQVILRLFREVFNHQNLSAINEFYASNMVDHSAFPGQAPGMEGIKSAIKGFFEILDNLEVNVEDVIAEGDKVVTRETWNGTHKPSGKTVEGSVIHIFYIRESRITDEWSRGWDWLENL
jgi:predicted ester cyclase